jgi:hypothetical protein
LPATADTVLSKVEVLGQAQRVAGSVSTDSLWIFAIRRAIIGSLLWHLAALWPKPDAGTCTVHPPLDGKSNVRYLCPAKVLSRPQKATGRATSS